MLAIVRRQLSILASCTLVIGLAGIAAAQDPQPPPAGGAKPGEAAPGQPSEKASAGAPGQGGLDHQVYDLLKTVINTGADLYNREADRAGCYRLYQGSLLTLRPLLGSHPDLQKAIDTGLAEAEQRPSMGARAFALRAVLDEIRAKLRPPGARPATAGVPAPRPAAKAPEIVKESAVPESLWKRLGGEAVIRQVVDDWVVRAAPDPQVNFDRGGKYKLTDAQVADLKEKMVEFISYLTGGPLKYKGKDMREVHRGMGITDAEFDAALADLRKVLEARSVKPAEEQDLLKLLQSTRKDIVEVKPKPEGQPRPVEKELPQKKTEPAKPG